MMHSHLRHEKRDGGTGREGRRGGGGRREGRGGLRRETPVMSSYRLNGRGVVNNEQSSGDSVFGISKINYPHFLCGSVGARKGGKKYRYYIDIYIYRYIYDFRQAARAGTFNCLYHTVRAPIWGNKSVVFNLFVHSEMAI